LPLQPFSPSTEDIYVANVETDRGTRERIRFIDTRGIESCDPGKEIIPKHLHAIADGFVIVYAINDENSFQIADLFRKDIEKHKEKKEVYEDRLCNKFLIGCYISQSKREIFLGNVQ
jgi:NF-kappa-B inhibitor-interacting Ras-like protein